ncbi:hypothetical protein B9Q03_00355 [Candidatus Marsarchaeota G2 archaeon OSP_D]|uniref:Uncharacterized protein n=1 Tax=Candidatus Marsarchaeota G2 archaeon OSP_D TaxID=1978157 RepID=A0A2R6B2D6_9ARCH|nr:MAG: hypothetical protein B9Q03_00355 [Candidatus Marsarchaeota G2 archaeon OSP_D]
MFTDKKGSTNLTVKGLLRDIKYVESKSEAAIGSGDVSTTKLIYPPKFSTALNFDDSSNIAFFKFSI